MPGMAATACPAAASPSFAPPREAAGRPSPDGLGALHGRISALERELEDVGRRHCRREKELLVQLSAATSRASDLEAQVGELEETKQSIERQRSQQFQQLLEERDA